MRVSTASTVGAFLLALAATLGASEVLVWGLSRLGVKLGLTAGLLGLLTALGADAPEISSASSALFSGASEVGIGVILGSNLFNLAGPAWPPGNPGRSPLLPPHGAAGRWWCSLLSTRRFSPYHDLNRYVRSGEHPVLLVRLRLSRFPDTTRYRFREVP